MEKKDAADHPPAPSQDDSINVTFRSIMNKLQAFRSVPRSRPSIQNIHERTKSVLELACSKILVIASRGNPICFRTIKVSCCSSRILRTKTCVKQQELHQLWRSGGFGDCRPLRWAKSNFNRLKPASAICRNSAGSQYLRSIARTRPRSSGLARTTSSPRWLTVAVMIFTPSRTASFSARATSSWTALSM